MQGGCPPYWLVVRPAAGGAVPEKRVVEAGYRLGAVTKEPVIAIMPNRK